MLIVSKCHEHELQTLLKFVIVMLYLHCAAQIILAREVTSAKSTATRATIRAQHVLWAFHHKAITQQYDNLLLTKIQ